MRRQTLNPAPLEAANIGDTITQHRRPRGRTTHVCSSSSLWNDFSVYSRKHLPGRVRPARPARCFADACAAGTSNRAHARRSYAEMKIQILIQTVRVTQVRSRRKHEQLHAGAPENNWRTRAGISNNGPPAADTSAQFNAPNQSNERTFEMGDTSSDSTRMRGLYT